jgi:LPS-assembly protein
MIKVRALFLAVVAWAALVATQAVAQQRVEPHIEIEAASEVSYQTNGEVSATNGVVVRYLTDDKSSNAVLTADRMMANQDTGDIFAEGSVRLQREDQTWIGDKLHYNFITREMDGEQFRTGKQPGFASGESMHGQGATATNTNVVYTAQYGMITADDYSKPLIVVRAKRLRIVPGDYVEAYNATMYVGGVPTFYFPYYRRDLKKNQNNFSLLPGYRSEFGPYLLSSYNWYWGDDLSGSVHADYREKRGVAGGPDVNANLGQFGEAKFKYYYTYDHEPGTNLVTGAPLPNYRQRVDFSYDASPVTNLSIKSQVAYWSDPYVTHDFFESQYQKNVQPSTYFDANKFWDNWSLDTLAEPRVNPFYETVERLPEVRLTGFRQEIFNTPVYYESQSSLGNYDRKFAETNVPPIPDFAGRRADTFHQITLPETFFGWLNFTPRAGGRFTYYSSDDGPGATNSAENREVFNTGAEVSFKASRVWSDSQNHFWDVNGLRHIIEPSIDYVYVPRPNVLPSQVPQYDYEPTNSLELTPIEFPDFNSIDSINSQNVLRFGLNNRLQTKRHGESEDLAAWQLYLDWNLRPRSDETTFSDIYSSFTLKPRTWLTFDSKTRFDIATQRFNLAQNRVTFEPDPTWSWSVGHLFLRSGPLFGNGDSLITSTFFFRLNENWGTRIAHYFDAQTGTLQEQDYSIYRDLRSWTAALTFREQNNLSAGKNYAVAFTMSLKAMPRFGLGSDSVSAANLVGY